MSVKRNKKTPFANTHLRKGNCGIYGFFLETVQLPDWFMTVTFRDRLGRNGQMYTPSRSWALAGLRDYYGDLEAAARARIGYILVLDVGELYGRLHAHALVAGVAHLDRQLWWEKALRQFGRTSIQPYQERIGGGQYIAKHALSESGDLYFGGRLLDPRPIKEAQPVGRVVVARSADVPSELFKMGLVRGGRR
jgi:hypothetical protein